MNVEVNNPIRIDEKPKNKGGRPRKPLPESGEPEKINSTAPASKQLHLPQLPAGRNAKPADLFTWWRALTPDELPHLVIYVYRKWPCVDAKRFDPKAPTHIRIYTGICPFTVENWEREVLLEFGSGDYAFFVNDDSAHRWQVHFRSIRDYENYPPAVDTKLLMLDEPANKDYVSWLRSRGRLDGIDTKGSESDMAVNEALNRSLDMTERLTDRVIDLSAAATDKPDMQANAQMRGMELLQEGAKESISFMRETMGEMARAQNQNSNPLEVVDKLVSVATAITGGNKGDSAILLLMKDMRESDREQMKLLREELADNRKLVFDLLMKRRDDDDEKPKGIAGMLTELRGIKDVAGDILVMKPKDGDEGEDGESGGGGKKKLGASILDAALRNAPTIMQGLTSITANILAAALAMRSGQPLPVPTAPAPTQPAQPQQVNGNPFTPFLTLITPTFLHHMNTDGLTGTTFAQWLIDSGPMPSLPQPGMTGKSVFDTMKEGGKDQIIGVLQLHAPLWENVKDRPAKLGAFIDELLKADEQEGEE